MATGRDMQLTKIIGEYLVCAELCRRELLATTLTGNAPEFDILATDKRWQYETQSQLDALIPERHFQKLKIDFMTVAEANGV